MARRHPIDPDELFETANRLVAEGKDVTATTLLDALGGGSLRTIYKYLEQWKDKAPIVPVKKAVDIPDRVQASFAMAWRMATDEAAIEIEAVKQKAAEDVAAAINRFQEALNAAERLEREAQEAAETIDGLKSQMVTLTEEVTSLSATGARYKATAEQLEQQVKAQGQELERMHKERAEEREEHAQQITKLEEGAAQSAKRYQQEIDSLRAVLDEARGKITEVEKQRDEAKTSISDSQKQLEKAEAAAKADRAERDAAIKEAAELKGLSGSLKEQNAALMAKLNSDEKSEKKK
ncbi:MAG: DNA-binding protein [Vicinamibacterales bacterium]|jgi:chromosome segregation ATPase